MAANSFASLSASSIAYPAGILHSGDGNVLWANVKLQCQPRDDRRCQEMRVAAGAHGD
jgi:hypothetical protein